MHDILVELLEVPASKAGNRTRTMLAQAFRGFINGRPSRGFVGPNSVLAVDIDTAGRVRHTLHRDLVRWFDTHVGAGARDDDEWLRIAIECDHLAAELRRLVRLGDERFIAPTMHAFEFEHSCDLVFVDPDVKGAFAKELNLTLARTVAKWAEIARGATLASEAIAQAGPLIPLSTVWGRTMRACLEARLRGRTHRYSATKKLTLVAHEMEAALGRTPIECMRPEHVAWYVKMLNTNGSKVGTIQNKLGVLASLVKDIAPAAALEALKQARPPRRAIEALRTKRRPMRQAELGAFLSAIFTDTSLHPDDRVVVALTALSSARIDEIASLQARDIKWDGNTWSLSITLAEEERKALLKWLPRGFALPGLKGVDSLRTIPVYVDAIPGLHERLVELARRPGYLFAHLSTTSAGRTASAIGRRINRRMKEVFGPDTDLVFESLRNTASPALRRAGVCMDLRRLHLGHAPIDIHARHYDEVSFDDLRAGARAIANFVRGALDGKQVPRLDLGYQMCRRVLKRDCAVLDKYAETGTVQERAFNANQAKVISLAQARLKMSSQQVATRSWPSLRVVHLVHPDLNPQATGEQEIGAL